MARRAPNLPGPNNSFGAEPTWSQSDPATDYVPVVKGAALLPDGPTVALLVGTAGTANLTTIDGVDRDGVPLQAGYNPLQVSKVRAGGTADVIFALY